MRVSVLGATGSVGRQSLAVLDALGGRAEALAAARGSPALLEAVRHYRPGLVAVAERPPESFSDGLPPGTRLVVGPNGLIEAATLPDVEIVVVAVTGIHGLQPTLAALAAGKRVALANKETLVAGGEIIMPRANPGQIVPVDSEHAALFQLLGGGVWAEGQRLWITSSGGALRDWPLERLAFAQVADVLRHPTWSMGPKVTVDSATLANKGLEVIEAHHLFRAPYDAISVMLHSESWVHALIEESDGSLRAELAPPDMALPIARALTWPERPPALGGRLPDAGLPTLDFGPVDGKRYPFLSTAYAAGKMGGIFPGVLNAANDEAVRLFLDGQITFPEIYRRSALAVDAAVGAELDPKPSLQAVFEADRWAKRFVRGAKEKGRFP